MRQELIYALVNSGSQLSEAVGFRNARGAAGVWVPTVASGTLQLYGSHNETAANFVPIEAAAPNTGTFPTGPGSKYLALGTVGEALPPFVKARLSAAVTAPATLVFVAKL